MRLAPALPTEAAQSAGSVRPRFNVTATASTTVATEIAGITTRGHVQNDRRGAPSASTAWRTRAEK